MKTNKLLLFLTPVFYLGISKSHAQQTLTSSGGDIMGTTGSISYSVGQLAYVTNFGTTGAVAQGVQQANEYNETLSSVDFTELLQELKVFPNPTTDVLTLNFNNKTDTQLDYQIRDINGRILKSETNIASRLSINISELQSAIYFLEIKNNNKKVKIFKIIKN
ncbi:T9SS type A sorting domain-containing protein [Lacinutrix neustonica]|uniref:T9SS type A sorting domain-containing protein n=1 Tax=Lacinutrix neustonica TaxID=2980107 RepID=A0A9E8SDF0_9FLAO|nr:T9SS type A sorting domain-containing protein [Lacinutrix neustonica]WAC02031.1 T9SS type A sorting domain-containing protein [Lacinutrix neustonica]